MDTVAANKPDEGADIYRAYFEEMPALVTILDEDLHIIDSNRHFRERFGDAIGKYCWQVYKRENKPCSQCAVRETFMTGERKAAEETFTDLNGREIPVIVRTAPVPSEGKLARVMKISANITDVKKLQKKLHKTQRRFQQLFNEVPCYVSVQNKDFRITDSNRKFKEDFGDEVGPYCYEAYKHRDEPCLNCPVAKTFDDGLSHRSEEVVTSTSGDQYNVLVQTAPIRNSKGEITNVVEMSTNITELRRLQDQLASLGLLVGSISHNIKGILAALDGGMYIVNSGFKKGKPERIEEGWDIVKRNVDQVRSMILGILYYAKDRELDLSSISALDLAEEALGKVQYKAEEIEIDLEKDFDPEVGMLEADPNSLRSALINILENALDACRVDTKKDSHCVKFGLSSDAEHIIMTILDNGIGMDRETREKAFSLFFSSKGNEGTGLGLFISNKIIEQHDGTIELDSTLNMGSSFTIRLPKKSSDDQ